VTGRIWTRDTCGLDRGAIGAVVMDTGRCERVTGEAAAAFRHGIALSRTLAEHAARRDSAA